jgi:hypothetical protein
MAHNEAHGLGGSDGAASDTGLFGLLCHDVIVAILEWLSAAADVRAASAVSHFFHAATLTPRHPFWRRQARLMELAADFTLADVRRAFEKRHLSAVAEILARTDPGRSGPDPSCSRASKRWAVFTHSKRHTGRLIAAADPNAKSVPVNNTFLLSGRTRDHAVCAAGLGRRATRKATTSATHIVIDPREWGDLKRVPMLMQQDVAAISLAQKKKCQAVFLVVKDDPYSGNYSIAMIPVDAQYCRTAKPLFYARARR